jgi:hypothetical protein
MVSQKGTNACVKLQKSRRRLQELNDLRYKPQKHGNVFDWILLNAEVLRQLRRMERDAIEEAAAKSEGLDETKMED